MTDKPQKMVSFNEDEEVIKRVDEIADAEGTTRTAIIRRALRALITSSPVVAAFTYQVRPKNDE